MHGRDILAPGTRLRLPGGGWYEITGAPIGSGGGSVVYPAVRLIRQADGAAERDGLLYALKECYPVSLEHRYLRSGSGEIVPERPSEAERYYLRQVQRMQLDERRVTQQIYRTSSRLVPILEAADSVELTRPGTAPVTVANTVTVMESLGSKGQPLTALLRERRQLPPLAAFRVIQQLLFALREVHQAGFLHLDLQDGNLYLKGSLEDESDIATLIDFGSARALEPDGQTAPIRDRVIFTTQGFSAPEILLRNDGNLRLGPEADLYSVGCLALYLLTGVRYDVRQLLQNTSGRYLTRFKLRRIRCKPHLVDRMQAILARALEPEPENRYHSAEEMLSEVSAFVKALEPSRTALDAVTYDAFLCYRHGPVDSPAAKELQTRLEHFRASRELTGQRKPFRRIFLDEGELSSCADFGAQIRAALKNAGWLIVLCSPQTPHSPWVQLEIDTFLEYHDRERILAVLTAGTPQESFPARLLGGGDGEAQVLAADARGDSLSAVRKKLRGDALLRLAAPMLGTTFDGLKQRQRLYTLRRAAAAAALVLLAAAGFTGYALVQSQRVTQAQRSALLNQSRYLAALAQEQLEQNDPAEAMETALAGLLTDSSPDDALLPQAQYVLTQALGFYLTPSQGANSVSVSGSFSHEAAITGSSLAADFSTDRLFTCDGEQIYVWKLSDCTLERTISPGGYLSGFRPELVLTARRQLVFAAGDQVWCYDYETGQSLWHYEAAGLAGVIADEAEETVLVVQKAEGQAEDGSTPGCSVRILALALDTGAERCAFSVALPASVTDVGTACGAMALSADGSLLAFNVRDDPELSDFTGDSLVDYEDWYAEEAADLVVVADLREQTGRVLSASPGLISALRFTQENALLLAAQRGDSYEQTSGRSRVISDRDGAVILQCRAAEQDTVLWQRSFSYGSDSDAAQLALSAGQTQTSVLLGYADKCALLSLEDGSVQENWELSGTVRSLWLRSDGTGFDAVTGDGRYQSVTFGETRWTSRPCFPDGLCDFLTDCQNTLLVVNEETPTVVTKYEFRADGSWQSIAADAEDSLLFCGDEKTAVFLDADAWDDQPDRVLLYDAGTGAVQTVTLDFGADSDAAADGLLGIEDRNGRRTLMISAKDNNRAAGDACERVLCLDLETLEQTVLPLPLPENPLDGSPFTVLSQVACTGDCVYFVCDSLSADQAGAETRAVFLYRWTVGDAAAELLGIWQEPRTDNLTLNALSVSADGAEILVSETRTQDSGAGVLCRVLRYDAAEQALVCVLDEIELDGYNSAERIGWLEASACFYVLFPDRIALYDSAGQERYTVARDSAEDAVRGLSLAPDGGLLVLTERGTLRKYDLSSGTLLGTLELDTDRFSLSGLEQLSFRSCGGSLLALSGSDTVLIDTDTERWGICGYVDNAFCYDADRDCFYVLDSDDGLGLFPRRSSEELIALGRAALNGES